MALQVSKYDFSEAQSLSRAQVAQCNLLHSVLPGGVFQDSYVKELARLGASILNTQIQAAYEGFVRVSQESLASRMPQKAIWAELETERGHTCLIDFDHLFIQSALSELFALPNSDVSLSAELTTLDSAGVEYLLLKCLDTLAQSGLGLSLRLRNIYISGAELPQEMIKRANHWFGLGYQLNTSNRRYGVRFWLPEELLQEEQVQILAGTEGYLERYGAQLDTRLELFSRLPVQLHVNAGQIELAHRDLQGLEPDDIILFENANLALVDGCLTGMASLKLGRGRMTRIQAQYTERRDQAAELEIENIEVRDMPPAPRWTLQHAEHAFSVGWADEQAAELERLMFGKHVETTGMNNLPASVDESQLDDVQCGMMIQPDDQRIQFSEPDDFDDFDEVDFEEDLSDSNVQVGGQSDDSGEGLPQAVAELTPDRAALAEDIPVTLTVELGRVELTAADVMRIRPGVVVELNRVPSAPVDLVVGDRRIGRGEVVQIEGELGVRILSIANGAS